MGKEKKSECRRTVTVLYAQISQMGKNMKVNPIITLLLVNYSGLL